MRIKHKRPQRPLTRKSKKTFFIFTLFFLMFTTVFSYGFYRFDRRILPLVLASTDLKIKTTINNAIHTEVNQIIRGLDVSALDFYVQSPEPNGSGNVLAVNTVLVNDICNASALSISQRLSEMEPELVSVPLGMAFGLDTLANAGPSFSFELRPTGNAQVNYASKFESVGINQVHFMVWLTVVSTVRIINPVQSSTITVTRDVSLVDTVITGTVPGTYLNMGTPGAAYPSAAPAPQSAPPSWDSAESDITH